MEDAVSISPAIPAYATRKPVLGEINGMQTALSFVAQDVETAHSQALCLCDVSSLERFGVKGPNAANWLQTAGMILPDSTNSWVLQDNGSLLMRLGNSEFLLEDRLENTLAKTLDNTAMDGSGVHKVLRNDAAFIVSGEQAGALFSQVCAIDLTGETLADNRLVMTSLAGVSVTLLKQTLNGLIVYRIWCDGTFGPYLWETLVDIIEQQGGGPVGFNFYYTLN